MIRLAQLVAFILILIGIAYQVLFMGFAGSEGQAIESVSQLQDFLRIIIIPIILGGIWFFVWRKKKTGPEWFIVFFGWLLITFSLFGDIMTMTGLWQRAHPNYSVADKPTSQLADDLYHKDSSRFRIKEIILAEFARRTPQQLEEGKAELLSDLRYEYYFPLSYFPKEHPARETLIRIGPSIIPDIMGALQDVSSFLKNHNTYPDSRRQENFYFFTSALSLLGEFPSNISKDQILFLSNLLDECNYELKNKLVSKSPPKMTLSSGNSGDASPISTSVHFEGLNSFMVETIQKQLLVLIPRLSGQAGVTEVSKQYVDLLQSGNPSTAEQAKQGLGKMRGPAVKDLIDAWNKEQDEDKKVKIAQALGEIGPEAKDSVPLLYPLVLKKSPKLMPACHEAIKKIGVGSLPYLIQNLNTTNDMKSKEYSVYLIKDMGPSAHEAIPQLIRVLKETNYNTDPRIMEYASDALKNIGTASFPATFQLLKEENYKMSGAFAARALADFGTDSAPIIPYLYNILKRPDPTYKFCFMAEIEAIQALGKIGYLDKDKAIRELETYKSTMDPYKSMERYLTPAIEAIKNHR